MENDLVTNRLDAFQKIIETLYAVILGISFPALAGHMKNISAQNDSYCPYYFIGIFMIMWALFIFDWLFSYLYLYKFTGTGKHDIKRLAREMVHFLGIIALGLTFCLLLVGKPMCDTQIRITQSFLLTPVTWFILYCLCCMIWDIIFGIENKENILGADCVWQFVRKHLGVTIFSFCNIVLLQITFILLSFFLVTSFSIFICVLLIYFITQLAVNILNYKLVQKNFPQNQKTGSHPI